MAIPESGDSLQIRSSMSLQQRFREVPNAQNGKVKFNMSEALKKLFATNNHDPATNTCLNLESKPAKIITKDSDLGKRLIERQKQSEQSVLPNMLLPKDELDDYVPVYEFDNSGPWPKSTLVGFRKKTPEEMSGYINY